MAENDKILTLFTTRVRQMILQYNELKKENDELYAMVDAYEAELTLTLLVTRIPGADDPDRAVTLDDLAKFASALYRCPHFHDSTSLSLESFFLSAESAETNTSRAPPRPSRGKRRFPQNRTRKQH